VDALEASGIDKVDDARRIGIDAKQPETSTLVSMTTRTLIFRRTGCVSPSRPESPHQSPPSEISSRPDCAALRRTADSAICARMRLARRRTSSMSVAVVDWQQDGIWLAPARHDDFLAGERFPDFTRFVSELAIGEKFHAGVLKLATNWLHFRYRYEPGQCVSSGEMGRVPASTPRDSGYAAPQL
jgi:hypothetical protein